MEKIEVIKTNGNIEKPQKLSSYLQLKAHGRLTKLEHSYGLISGPSPSDFVFMTPDLLVHKSEKSKSSEANELQEIRPQGNPLVLSQLSNPFC